MALHITLVQRASRIRPALTALVAVCSLLVNLALPVPMGAQSRPATLAAPQTRPEAEDYKIGPYDILTVTVWGHATLSGDFAVDPHGKLALPLIGPVPANGLTPGELATRVRDFLAKDYLVDPQVFVVVKDYLSKRVSVLGEAERPGVYYLTGQTTLLDILSKAGGFSKSAGRQLVVYRNERGPARGTVQGNTIITVNLEKLQNGDLNENIRLQDADMVIVPRARSLFVLGEVQKPGAIPLDKELTLLEAVTLAGWFKDSAAPSAIKVTRRIADGRQDTFSLDLSGANPKDRGFRLQDGDTVLVPQGNSFFVFGEVRKPGSYQLSREVNILEAITIAGGFTEKASPGRTRVIRTTPKGPQILNIDMNDIVRRGQRDKAITLQENDVIVVPESFF